MMPHTGVATSYFGNVLAMKSAPTTGASGHDRIRCQVYGSISTSLSGPINARKLLILTGLSPAWLSNWVFTRTLLHLKDL
jgi:hypothetical protein